MRIAVTVLCGLICASVSYAAGSVSYDHNSLRKKIVDNKVEIQSCYEEALKRDPELKGKLNLKLKILANGEIDKIKVLNSLNSKVDGCVSRKIVKWDLPKPPMGQSVEVDVPFEFKADSETL